MSKKSKKLKALNITNYETPKAKKLPLEVYVWDDGYGLFISEDINEVDHGVMVGRYALMNKGVANTHTTIEVE